MKPHLLATIILLIGSMGQADAKKQADRFPPMPSSFIDKGWLHLFDGTTTFGWTIDGEAKVEEGRLVLGGSKPTTAFTATHFGPHILSFAFKYDGSPPAEFLFDHQWRKLDGSWSAFDGGHANLHKRGPIGFRVPAGSKLTLTVVRLQPVQLRSIFNGRDLYGWKVFPGKKSTFTVNDKKELILKNGPGDLQTEGSWGNFVLQLQCISNGKYLNSGVFFRCRPGEYQNGYEAQIRNQFATESILPYTIEEYDPKTHKLIGKTMIKSPAVDYGTGGIYRRQPARRQMSRDLEWFNMTIIAHDNHFATWVNGIQVTDWKDNRPHSDNARNGCRLEAGPISLQGHDPTTDLGFRNMRIAEMPPER
ncbi:MAG TPA: DUF1080 domain-containing protein [Gemmataceae bacterium]|nr:DUF1080 domain-containing protein [Gemmataceae bacterium]